MPAVSVGGSGSGKPGLSQRAEGDAAPACRGARRLPGAWHGIQGSPRVPEPRDAARPKPWCFCGAGGRSKPTARPGAAGDPVTPGWAGPCAPEPHQHRMLLHGAPASHRLKDAEFGQCPNPEPSAGTEQGILLRPKSGFIITARPLCKQISPRWVPPGRFWGESHPAGLSPAGTGKAVLVLGAGRAPGPEAAAAQLIPALASPGTFCPCRPRDGHRLCVSRPRGTAQTASAAATGMAPSILRAGEGRGKGEPPKRGRRSGVSQRPAEP